MATRTESCLLCVPGVQGQEVEGRVTRQLYKPWRLVPSPRLRASAGREAPPSPQRGWRRMSPSSGRTKSASLPCRPLKRALPFRGQSLVPWRFPRPPLFPPPRRCLLGTCNVPSSARGAVDRAGPVPTPGSSGPIGKWAFTSRTKPGAAGPPRRGLAGGNTVEGRLGREREPSRARGGGSGWGRAGPRRRKQGR